MKKKKENKIAMNYPIVVETTLPQLKIFDRTPSWDIYQLNDRLLLVALDRITVSNQVIKNPIPLRGILMIQILTRFFQVFHHQIPSFFITSDLNKITAVFQESLALLRGRSFLVKKTSLVPLECEIIRYCFHPFANRLSYYAKLTGLPIDRDITYGEPFSQPLQLFRGRKRSGKISYLTQGQIAEIIGDKIADDIRHLSLQAFFLLEEFLKSVGFYLARINLKWGFHNGDLMLSHFFLDEGDMVLLDRFPKEEIRSFPVSYEYEPVAKYCQAYPLPNGILPEEIIQEVRERYLRLYEKITGKSWNSFLP